MHVCSNTRSEIFWESNQSMPAVSQRMSYFLLYLFLFAPIHSVLRNFQTSNLCPCSSDINLARPPALCQLQGMAKIAIALLAFGALAANAAPVSSHQEVGEVGENCPDVCHHADHLIAIGLSSPWRTSWHRCSSRQTKLRASPRLQASDSEGSSRQAALSGHRKRRILEGKHESGSEQKS